MTRNRRIQIVPVLEGKETQGQSPTEGITELNPEIADVLNNQGDRLKKLMEAKAKKEVDPKILNGLAVYIDAIRQIIPASNKYSMAVSGDLSKKLGLGSDTSLKISNKTPIRSKPNDKFAYLRVDLNSILTKDDDRSFARTEAYDPSQDEDVIRWQQQNIDITIDQDENGKPFITGFSKGFTTRTHIKNYKPDDGRRPKEGENINGVSITNGKGPTLDEEKLLLLLNETVQKMASEG